MKNECEKNETRDHDDGGEMKTGRTKEERGAKQLFPSTIAYSPKLMKKS